MQGKEGFRSDNHRLTVNQLQSSASRQLPWIIDENIIANSLRNRRYMNNGKTCERILSDQFLSLRLWAGFGALLLVWFIVGHDLKFVNCKK